MQFRLLLELGTASKMVVKNVFRCADDIVATFKDSNNFALV